jgi:hypothetical protein
VVYSVPRKLSKNGRYAVDIKLYSTYNVSSTRHHFVTSLPPFQEILDSFERVGAMPGDTTRYTNLVELSINGLIEPYKSIFLDAAIVFHGRPVAIAMCVWTAMYDDIDIHAALQELQQRSLLGVVEGRLKVHDVVRSSTKILTLTLQPNKRVWRTNQVRCCTCHQYHYLIEASPGHVCHSYTVRSLLYCHVHRMSSRTLFVW